jgi:RNA polymerase sigma-70 factor, ECF subfamily
MTRLAHALHDAQECYRLGVTQYPDIRWTWDDFQRAWPSDTEEDSIRPSAEEFLRLACLNACPGATDVLEREFIEPLRGDLRRTCVTDEATDAALQLLREKLLLAPHPRLASYRSVGSFRAWLKVVATRTALDMMRQRGVVFGREVEFEDRMEGFAIGPEERYLREESRAVLRTALRAAIKRLPDEHRQALRMHVIGDWNIARIGQVFGVHRATVARWLVSAKDQLRGLLREELACRLPTSDAQADLLLSDMPSRLDLTLSSAFATTGISRMASDSPQGPGDGNPSVL